MYLLAGLFRRVGKICKEKGVRLVGENSHVRALFHLYSMDMMLFNSKYCER
jgi:ABC-type transporter Mla MlaB component